MVTYFTKQGEEALSIFPGFKEHINLLKQNKDKPYSDSKQINDFIESIINKKGDYNGSSFKGYRRFDDNIAKICNEYFKPLKNWLKENFKDKDKLFKQIFILQQIPIVYQEWRKRKADARQQSYGDMIASVYEGIKASFDNDRNLITGSLCEKLRNTYRIGIIDEFQDTNAMQWKIFAKLFLQSKENRDHQLIVVGDPKQSIYSFQNADVNVYTSATEKFSMRSSLKTNYRSTNPMIEACNALFQGQNKPAFFNSAYKKDEIIDSGIAFTPSDCPAADKKKTTATLDGKEVPAVWFSPESDSDNINADQSKAQTGISPKTFAKQITKLILHCCKRNENGKTRLQVFHKDNTLGNVSFRDFAILARSKTEMTYIKRALADVGIPYQHYKEDNLFNSRECVSWIALCRAILATDFSYKNRKLLTEALITDFFAVDLNKAENENYDSPTCNEREAIAKFQALARQRKWAAMLETIYRETRVQERLSDLTHLQELARIRQIGQYIADRLYDKHCDLGDVVRDLQKLHQIGKATEDENANLVARNSDFDVVTVMTIHASKGLQFPIVIAVAGFKGFYTSKQNASYLYHNNNIKYLGISDEAKNKNFEEQYLEWQRLFYVAYTRAQSLLVIPRYAYSKNEFAFLKNTLENLNINHKDYRDNDLLGPRWDENVDSKTILHLADMPPEHSTFEDQERTMSSLNGSLDTLYLKQHSYSSLASKESKQKETNQEQANVNEDDDVPPKGIDDANDEQKDRIDIISQQTTECFDKGISIECDYSSKDKVPHYDGYPCGTKLGTAVHEVFEHIDFADSRKDSPNDCLAIREQARLSFIRAGFAASNDKQIDDTTAIVWNSLHAVLPAICGNKKGNDSFKLCELESDAHFPEVEFEMLPNVSADILKAYATGSIDLLFVRNGRYAIVDWKTNRLTPEKLGDPQSIKEDVDAHYAIQRVLYSYCLIQWLKTFHTDKSCEEIFDEYFGGVYYVYVRGCCADTGLGVYAHTWESYNELQKSYDEIAKKMHQKEKTP